MNDEKNVIEQILENYVTKTVAIVGVTIVVIKAVILPIQSIEINLAQVQKDLAELRQYDTRISGLEKMQAVQSEQLNELVNARK